MEDITQAMDGVAEGVSTDRVAWTSPRARIGDAHHEKIYRVLYEGSVQRSSAELMGAQFNHELSGRKWELFSFLTRRKRP